MQREFSGVMAKPWRIVVLSLGALATMFLVLNDQPYWIGGFSILDWTHFVILAGCVQTPERRSAILEVVGEIAPDWEIHDAIVVEELHESDVVENLP